jgi:hypothetical protein
VQEQFQRKYADLNKMAILRDVTHFHETESIQVKKKTGLPLLLTGERPDNVQV